MASCSGAARVPISAVNAETLRHAWRRRSALTQSGVGYQWGWKRGLFTPLSTGSKAGLVGHTDKVAFACVFPCVDEWIISATE